MTKLPQIDLRLADDPQGLRLIAEQVEQALTTVGFLTVVGHGISQSTFDKAYAAMEQLVNAPIDVKEAIASDHVYRGFSTHYMKSGAVMLDRFQINRFNDSAEAKTAGVPEEFLDYFTPNLWPNFTGWSKDDVMDCFNQMRKVGHRLMQVFTAALGLPNGYFNTMLHNDASAFAINSYPPQPADENEQTVLPIHSDSGMLTLLHQTGNYAGLEIFTEGEWHTIEASSDILTINIGDLMSRWTNDHWVATKHRVKSGAGGAAKRTSIATFYLPSVEVVVSPLDVLLSGNPPRYEPVSTYDWEGQYVAQYYSGGLQRKAAETL